MSKITLINWLKTTSMPFGYRRPHFQIVDYFILLDDMSFPNLAYSKFAIVTLESQLMKQLYQKRTC